MSGVADSLAAIGDRADDVRVTLQSFSVPRAGDSWGATVSQFQHLSKQLQVLHDRLHDSANEGKLASLLALPAEVAHERMGAVPTLLSTRVDKEHEGELAQLEMQASRGAMSNGTMTIADVEEHNSRVDAASEFFKEATAALDLPKLDHPGARGTGVAQAGPSRPGQGGMPSGAGMLPSKVPPATAKALLGALRTGQGLPGRTDMAKRQRT